MPPHTHRIIINKKLGNKCWEKLEAYTKVNNWVKHQKVKTRIPTWLSDFSCKYTVKGVKGRTQTSIGTAVFSVTLVRTAKKQEQVPSTDKEPNMVIRLMGCYSTTASYACYCVDEPWNAMSSETNTIGFFLYEVACGGKLIETVEQLAAWQNGVEWSEWL